MNRTLKNLFLAMSICCVHVALPSEVDFTDWDEQDFVDGIEELRAQISLDDFAIEGEQKALANLPKSAKQQEIEENLTRLLRQKSQREALLARAISALNARHLEQGG